MAGEAGPQLHRGDGLTVSLDVGEAGGTRPPAGRWRGAATPGEMALRPHEDRPGRGPLGGPVPGVDGGAARPTAASIRPATIQAATAHSSSPRSSSNRAARRTAARSAPDRLPGRAASTSGGAHDGRGGGTAAAARAASASTTAAAARSAPGAGG